MSFSSVFLLLCLVVASAVVHAQVSRNDTGAYCSESDCEAAARKDGEAIRASVQNGTDLCECICNRKKKTILHLAATVECVVCVDVLVSPPLECALNVTDRNRNTPLHDAARACQSPMTNLYLDEGADPDVKNRFGKTPLCLAVRNNEEKCAGVAQDLIKKGADKCKKCNGRTPYQIAKNKVTRDILEQLGADTCP